MSNWTPTTYKTKNWSDDNQALKQRGSLSIWFDVEMAWDAAPSGKRGRQQSYNDAAIQACLTIKVLFSLPVRRQGFWHQWQLKLGESSAHLVGWIMRRVVCDASVAFRVSYV